MNWKRAARCALVLLMVVSLAAAWVPVPAQASAMGIVVGTGIAIGVGVPALLGWLGIKEDKTAPDVFNDLVAKGSEFLQSIGAATVDLLNVYAAVDSMTSGTGTCVLPLETVEAFNAWLLSEASGKALTDLAVDIPASLPADKVDRYVQFLDTRFKDANSFVRTNNYLICGDSLKIEVAYKHYTLRGRPDTNLYMFDLNDGGVLSQGYYDFQYWPYDQQENPPACKYQVIGKASGIQSSTVYANQKLATERLFSAGKIGTDAEIKDVTIVLPMLDAKPKPPEEPTTPPPIWLPFNPQADPETETQKEFWHHYDITVHIDNPPAPTDPPDVTDPTVTNPTTPTDPAPTQPPDTEDPPSFNNMTLDLKSFFPFCIPFDLYDFFNLLAADPVTPSFSWDLPLPGGGTHTMEIDLSAFDGVAAVCRKLMALAFLVGLAIKTRDLIKG